MPGQKRSVILIVTVAMMAFVGLWFVAPHFDQGRLSHSRSNDVVGSAQEAFEWASLVIQDYLHGIDTEPFQIDPQYRASLSSRSKIWTIRGNAFCLRNEDKSYQWIVILNYHEMQEWEILAKIVSPDTRGPDGSQKPGISKTKGPLFEENSDR
jgi:hypothetical protein